MATNDAQSEQRPASRRKPALTGGSSPASSSTATRVLVALAIVALVGFFIVRAPTDPPLPAAAADAGVDGSPAVAAPDRCKPHGPAEGFRIGEAGPGAAGGSSADQQEALRLAPFAVEIGGATRFSGGFAVGVKHPGRDGLRSAVAFVAADSSLVVGLLEPNASGLSVRLGRIVGDELSWGAELSQGRDESLAYDMELGAEVVVVAWDDVVEEPARSVIVLATVTSASLEGGEAAKVVSSAGTDAEQPRVVKRAGGFWLAYVARAAVDEEDRPDEPDSGRYAAERIAPTWIELLPLDERGAPAGQPRAVTDKRGHVLAFDMEVGHDGGAIIAWRDDDTPSGAHGGRVTSMHVSASGAGQTQTVADEHVGSGVPNLLPGWIAVPTDEGRLALAPMEDDGQLRGEPRVEQVLGIGQVLAAGSAGVLLLARPSGKAMDLMTVMCADGER